MKEYEGMYVSIMLCSDCNNDCKHCYISYNGSFSQDRLDELIPVLMRKYKVLFNGTEPIIHPEYFKYFKMANNNIIMTNGIALRDEELLMDKLLESGIDEIALSYHYGIQDDISLITISDLDKLVLKLKDKGFRVKLMCSVSTDNYLLIKEACEKALELGADRIRFTNFIQQGNAIDNYDSKILLNEDQIEYVLRTIKHERELIDEDKLYIERCGTFGKSKVLDDNFKCIGIDNMVAVTPDERVYGCIFDTSKGNEIGYIDESNRIMIDEKAKSDKNHCKTLIKYNKILR